MNIDAVFSDQHTCEDINRFASVNYYVVKPKVIWFNVGASAEPIPNSLRELFGKYPRFKNHLITQYPLWQTNNESFVEIQRVITIQDNIVVNTVTLSLDELISLLNEQAVKSSTI